MKPVHRLALVLVAAAAALLAGAGLAGPAGAHGPTGAMGIEVLPGTTPLTANVKVLLEYANDREVVTGATVTATATGPGAPVAATPLADRGQGIYEGTLTLPAPGDWTISVTSADPVAAAEATVTVSASPSPTGTSGTLDGDLGPPKGDATPASDATGTSDGPSAALLAVIAVVLVAGVAVAFTLVRRS